jgi:prepilin-type processing-associated H-X9-DG protein
MYDFDTFHGPKTGLTSRNFLYVDGHVDDGAPPDQLKNTPLPQ